MMLRAQARKRSMMDFFCGTRVAFSVDFRLCSTTSSPFPESTCTSSSAAKGSASSPMICGSSSSETPLWVFCGAGTMLCRASR
eukprot:Skav210178  [mRNA]  locus=scaffold2101:102869:111583:+ [translate_table: standard]